MATSSSETILMCPTRRKALSDALDSSHFSDGYKRNLVNVRRPWAMTSAGVFDIRIVLNTGQILTPADNNCFVPQTKTSLVDVVGNTTAIIDRSC